MVMRERESVKMLEFQVLDLSYKVHEAFSLCSTHSAVWEAISNFLWLFKGYWEAGSRFASNIHAPESGLFLCSFRREGDI